MSPTSSQDDTLAIEFAGRVDFRSREDVLSFSLIRIAEHAKSRSAVAQTIDLLSAMWTVYDPDEVTQTLDPFESEDDEDTRATLTFERVLEDEWWDDEYEARLDAQSERERRADTNLAAWFAAGDDVLDDTDDDEVHP